MNMMTPRYPEVSSNSTHNKKVNVSIFIISGSLTLSQSACYFPIYSPKLTYLFTYPFETVPSIEDTFSSILV